MNNFNYINTFEHKRNEEVDLWCFRGGSLPIARCASRGIPLYL